VKTSFKEKLKLSLRLAAIFFKIGLFSFGGGYAMFSMIEREIVEKRNFLTHSELMDVFAVAESTPGAVAVNTATFVGTKKAGVLGGIMATIGLMLPSIIIIMALSYVISEFRDNKWVNYLFKGIRAGVLVLIAKAVISFYRNMRKDWLDFVLLIGAFCIAFLTDASVRYISLGTIAICILTIVLRNVKMKRIGATTKDIYVRETRDIATDCNMGTDGDNNLTDKEDAQ
jgi:chromate transporter